MKYVTLSIHLDTNDDTDALDLLERELRALADEILAGWYTTTDEVSEQTRANH